VADKATTAAKNKRIRQEALREQLSSQGHLQHVIDLCDKLGDEGEKIEPLMIQRYSKVIDTKLALIKKYCPDLKAVELTGDVDVRTVVIRKDLTGNAND